MVLGWDSFWLVLEYMFVAFDDVSRFFFAALNLFLGCFTLFLQHTHF